MQYLCFTSKKQKQGQTSSNSKNTVQQPMTKNITQNNEDSQQNNGSVYQIQTKQIDLKTTEQQQNYIQLQNTCTSFGKELSLDKVNALGFYYLEEFQAFNKYALQNNIEVNKLNAQKFKKEQDNNKIRLSKILLQELDHIVSQMDWIVENYRDGYVTLREQYCYYLQKHIQSKKEITQLVSKIVDEMQTDVIQQIYDYPNFKIAQDDYINKKRDYEQAYHKMSTYFQFLQ